ncbi:MAG: ABC transporter permease [Fusicatenibacter sp.]
MFFDLIRKNTRRCRRENGILYASLILSIIAFYVILSLEQQDVMKFLKKMESDAVTKLLRLLPLLYGFSLVILFFLIFYAEKYQMERRSRELGMYQMMGMTRSRLMALLMAEDLWTSLISLGIGLPSAGFLSELISLITDRVAGLGIIGHQPFFSMRAALVSCVGFLLIKLLAFGILCAKMASMEINSLLTEQKKERGMVIRRTECIAELILGICFLGIAFGCTMKQESWMKLLGMTFYVFLGTLGTFLVFYGLRAGVELISKKMQKKKTLGVFTFCELQESVIQSPNVLAVTSLLIWMAICCFAFGIAVGWNSRNQERHVLDYTIIGEKEKISRIQKDGKITSNFEELFEVRLESLYSSDGRHSFSWDGILRELENQIGSDSEDTLATTLSQYTFPYMISLSGYNRIVEAAGNEPLSLAEDQVAFYVGPEFCGDVVWDRLQEAAQSHPEVQIDGKYYEIAECTSEDVVVDRAITIAYGLVIPDPLFDQLFEDQYESYWNAILKETPVKEEGLMQTILAVNELLDQTGIRYESYLQNMGRQLFYQVAGSYTTLYLAAVFLIVANTVLSVQFLMRQQKNRKRYLILSKLGSSYEALSGSARNQICWYFGLPISVAFVGSFFGVRSLLWGLLPSGSREKLTMILGIAIAVILLLFVVEWLYLLLAMRISDRHLLEMMEPKREE